MSIKTIRIVRGDTFRATAIYRDSDGDPVDLDAAGITVEAVARDPSGRTTVPLTVAMGDQATAPGTYTVTGDTADWVSEYAETGKGWLVRIRYTSPLGTFSSEMVEVNLVP